MGNRIDNSISKQLSVLISELEQCREDDRGANTLILQVIAAGVAALAIVFALATSEEGSVLQGVNWLFPVFAVGIIIAVFSYATSLGIKSSIRYHYMRHLESEIIRVAGMNNHFGWNEIASPIITLNVNHIRTSWAVKHYVSIASAVFMALAMCILIGMCFFLGKDPSFGALAIICVVPFLALFLSNFGGTSNSLNMYNRALEIAKEKRAEKFSSGDSEKSNLSNVETLIAYLIYPRPQDALKILFILFGVCLGVAFSEGNLNSVDGWLAILVAFAASFFVFDFLGYQARYQWNDIRGYNEDKNNPEEKKRGRLPHIAGKEKLSPKLSFAVAAYRLLFAVVICWCNPLNVGFQLFICLLAIFVIAAVYEYARSKSGTLTILMLVLVSLGYPLRIFVGLWVACPNLFSMLSDSSNVLIFVLLTVASILFGMVFVGLTWALEGADHHIKRGAKPYHKHHVDELALKLPGVFDELYPLKNIRPVFAIWNIAMCLSTLLMCAVLVFLAPEMGLGVLACSLFIGWFLCMWIISDPTPGAIYMVVGIMLIVGSMFCLFFYFPQSGLSSRDSTLWCFVAIGLAVYLLIYTGFRNTNYEEMNSSLDNVKKAVASLYKALIGAIIGRQMVELLQGVDTAEGSNINKEKSNS